MKIVVLGSYSTGKTTLTRGVINYLRKEYEKKVFKKDHEKTLVHDKLTGDFRWRILPDAPRIGEFKGFSLNEGTSLETQWWIISKQLEMEMLTPKPWVADKCLIDVLAFTHIIFKDDPDFLREAEKVIKNNVNYDLILYLPTGEFPIEDDGIRSLDTNFQKSIDDIILKILEEQNINHYKITGNKEERLEKAKNIIDELIVL